MSIALKILVANDNYYQYDKQALNKALVELCKY